MQLEKFRRLERLRQFLGTLTNWQTLLLSACIFEALVIVIGYQSLLRQTPPIVIGMN
jgi:hypothetical protein